MWMWPTLPTDMVNPSDHVKTPVWYFPPHLTGNSIFWIPRLELCEELSAVSKLVYDDELPESVHITSYHSDIIPGSFAFHHVNQMAAKAQIIKALELGFNHLRHNKLKVSAELTCTILRKPRIQEVIIQLEDFFKNLRVVHDFEDINGVAPNLDVLASIGKNSPFLGKRLETIWWNKEWQSLDCLVGKRIMIWNNGGILMTSKSFALPTSTR